MRLMTYNICSGMSYGKDRRRDLQQCAEVIKKYNPDILGLNEVHYNIGFSDFAKQAEELSKILDYKFMYYGKAGAIKEGYQGNALFSRFPIRTVKTVLIDQPLVFDEDTYYEQRSYIDSLIDVADGLRVIVTHFGLAVAERKNALDSLLPIFKDKKDHILKKEKLVFMGDLNVEPDNIQLKMISSLLKDTADISDNSLYTFPSDIPQRKIDYIFVSDDITIDSVLVPDTLASDHLPYIADISLV